MKKRKFLILILSIITFIVTIFSVFGIYVNNYYKATNNANDALVSSSNVEVINKKNQIVFQPKDNVEAALIFYPGGKVEYTSYAPLMQEYANNGILSILVKMPFNLAVFDINAADGIKNEYPNVNKWFIGGHSLGGSMAASYLKNNFSDFDGLLLLGSYSTTNLTNTNLKVVSVYGSNDGVMNKKSYGKNKINIPSDEFYEYVIEGGCHSYFGDYGLQNGDGEPTISLNEQIRLTVEFSKNIFLK